MKLYYYNCGWEGAACVISDSKERALELIKQSHAYCVPSTKEIDIRDIQEAEIGEVIDVGGDY